MDDHSIYVLSFNLSNCCCFCFPGDITLQKKEDLPPVCFCDGGVLDQRLKKMFYLLVCDFYPMLMNWWDSKDVDQLGSSLFYEMYDCESANGFNVNESEPKKCYLIVEPYLQVELIMIRQLSRLFLYVQCLLACFVTISKVWKA